MIVSVACTEVPMPMHRSLLPRIRPYIILLVVAWTLLSLIAPLHHLHAQSSSSLRVISVDTSRAPQIDITVDYTLANGQPTTSAPQFLVQSNNQPLTVTGVERKRIPINVAVVTDLSARMSDQGAPYTTRFQNMLPLVQDLVSQLQANTNYVSLITVNDSVRIPHPLTNDIQAVVNTLNRGNPDLIFEPVPLDGANLETAYPLFDGIRNAIAQLVTGEVRPRVLVIFTSGGIEADEIDRLRQEIEIARNDSAPIKVLVFSFGSESNYTKFPGATTALDDLARALNGTLIDIGSELPSIATRALIDAQFEAILQRGEPWIVSANAGNIPAGMATIQVEADDSLGEYTFQNPVVPPSVSVTASSNSWQGEIILTMTEQTAQAPILEAEYLLDNSPLGASRTQSDGFAYTLDSTKRDFLNLFPPGEHSLIVAVTDERGMQNRSEPIIITVLKPEGIDWMAYWWVLIPLALGGGIFILFMSKGNKRPIKTPTAPFPTPQPSPNNVEVTAPYNSVSDDNLHATADFNPHATADYDPHATADFDPNAPEEVGIQWSIRILEGAKPETFDLQQEKRHFRIGRPSDDNHPDIPIQNKWVSREHAKIKVLLDSLELSDNGSKIGTFLGEERRRLEKHEQVTLNDGDIFWLGRDVKIRIESHTP